MQYKRVKIKLMLWQYNLKYSWLIAELKKHGVNVDKSSISEILSGRRNGEKAKLVIDQSLDILERYEKVFACE